MHYTFHLRHDVKFQNGEPFNAAAVKANFEHVVAPATASADAASLIGFAETGGFYVGTEAVDEFTVRVDFRQPYAPFLQAVSTAKLGFYAPAVLKDKVAQLGAGGPDISVGTGPYTLTEYVPDQKIVFTANPDYNWAPEGSTHQGPPAIHSLVFRILPESSVRTGALTSGDAQIASDIAPNTVAQIGDGFTIKKIAIPGLPYSLVPQREARSVRRSRGASGVRARHRHRPAVKTIYQGQVARAWSILAPTTPNSYDASLEKSWSFDPAKANALLDAAGWTARDSAGYRMKDGQRLSARWIAWTPVSDANASLADVVQSDLKQIGFEIVRDNLEVAKYYDAYGQRDFDLSDWSFPSVDADVLRAHLHSNGYKNGSSVSDPTVDKLLDDAVASSDPAVRAGLYEQLQQWNAKQIAMVPISVSSAITAYSKSSQGLTFDLYGQPLFYGASLAAGQ